MKVLTVPVVLFALVTLAGCSPGVGSERWCKQMADRPKSEWSLEDAKDYAAHCVVESTTIGSEAWCKNLEKKPKGDWTANEAADYAKHCVVK